MLDFDQSKKAQARMESKRSNVDAIRAEIGPLLLDIQGNFRGQTQSEGYDLSTRRLDSYAALAMQDGVSGFEGFVMPKGQLIQKFRVGDDAVNDRHVNRLWLEALARRIFVLRNDPMSGWTWNLRKSACSLFSFGEQSFWPSLRRDARGRVLGLGYQSEWIDGVYYELNAEDRIHRSHRKVMLTAEQAVGKWGEKVPRKVKDCLVGLSPTPDKSFTFVHVIEPNMGHDPDRIDHMGKAFMSGYYLEGCDEGFFDVGGYRTMRRVISGFDRMPNETHGRSNNMLVLPEIRAQQIMKQDRVLMAELAAKPPLLTDDDDLDRGVLDLSPWGVTKGGLDESKRANFQTFLEQADASGARELTAEDREVIDRANFRDLMQINKEYKSHISATKTLEEIAEKGIYLGPLARQEDEWFSQVTEVELSLMEEMGLLDDAPPELADYFASEGGIDIIYDNDLSRLREAGGLVGLSETGQFVAGQAQVDPAYATAYRRMFDPSIIVREFARIRGVPARFERSEEEIEAFDQKELEREQLDQLLQAAPVIGDTAQKLAGAEASLAPV